MIFIYILGALIVVLGAIALFSNVRMPRLNVGNINLPRVSRDYWGAVGSAVLAIILIHVFMYLWYKDFFDSWWRSDAFWFTLFSVACAVLVRIFLYKKNPWYYIMLVALPTLAIYSQYHTQKKSTKIDAGMSTSQDVKKTDTTKRKVVNFLETTLDPYEKYEVTLPGANSEVLVEMANFKQVISTNDRGFKKVKTLTPGDSTKNEPGKIIFTHTKGQGVPIVKFWKKF